MTEKTCTREPGEKPALELPAEERLARLYSMVPDIGDSHRLQQTLQESNVPSEDRVFFFEKEEVYKSYLNIVEKSMGDYEKEELNEQYYEKLYKISGREGQVFRYVSNDPNSVLFFPFEEGDSRYWIEDSAKLVKSL